MVASNKYDNTMKTIIYKNVEEGDWVKCSNCGKVMLLPYGADMCPECTCEDELQWVDDNLQEANIETVGEIEHSERELKHQDYLCCDTLADEYPDYYRKIHEENYLE